MGQSARTIMKRSGDREWLECSYCGRVVGRDWTRCNCGRNLKTIREERSWYSDGWAIVSDDSVNWDRLPYRRFTVPWRGRQVGTPWTKRREER